MHAHIVCVCVCAGMYEDVFMCAYVAFEVALPISPPLPPKKKKKILADIKRIEDSHQE